MKGKQEILTTSRRDDEEEEGEEAVHTIRFGPRHTLCVVKEVHIHSVQEDQWYPELDDAISNVSRRDEEGEEQRGGTLLEFDLEPVGPRRRWKNTLEKQCYQARQTG